MDIEIRQVKGQKLDWAAALMASSDPWLTLGVTLEKCKKMFTEKENLFFVAYLSQVPCGLMVLQDKGVAGSPYIKSLVLEPAFRNRGIGKLMLDFAEEKYRHHSRYLFLCVSSFNQSARKFYEFHGFKLVGILKDYLVEGYDEWLMHKRLKRDE